MTQGVSGRANSIAANPAKDAANGAPPIPDCKPATFIERETPRGAVRLRIDPGTVPLRQGPSGPFDKPAGTSFSTAEALAQFVFRHGRHFDSYLATEPGRITFRSRSGEGLISYTRRGRYVLVGGGLIAPDAHRPQLLDEFVEFLSQHKWRVAFHNLAEEELALFRERGFQVTKWGEEQIIDLAGCTWSGKAFEWVRRQSNYCLRNGVTASEVRPEELEPEQWSRTLNEVCEVAAESLSQKPQSQEMTFFEGRIGEHALGLRRLFVARSLHGAGRMEAFLICNPMRAGTSWAIELYRRRLDSVRGTMPFLFHQAMQQFQAEGVERIGLCLDPGYNCGTPLPGDSFLIRRGMSFSDRYLGMIFDHSGVRHFKARFRPRYENRYVCALPKISIGSVVSFLRVSGLLKLDLVKVGRNLADHWRKRASRKTLSDGE